MIGEDVIRSIEQATAASLLYLEQRGDEPIKGINVQSLQTALDNFIHIQSRNLQPPGKNARYARGLGAYPQASFVSHNYE